jgi:hypothetical protein
MIVVPIFWFTSDMIMPAEMFIVIAGMQATFGNKLLYFLLEQLGLTAFLAHSPECAKRVR